MARVTLSADAAPAHQQAQTVATAASALHSVAAHPAGDTATRSAWAHAAALGNGATAAHHTHGLPSDAVTAMRHQHAAPAAALLAALHQAGAVLSSEATAAHQVAQGLSTQNRQQWQRALVLRAQLNGAHQVAAPAGTSAAPAHQAAVSVRWVWRPVHQPAQPVPHGPGWVLVLPPPPPARRTPTTHLLFTCPPLVQVPGSTALLYRLCDTVAPPPPAPPPPAPPPPPPPPGDQLVIDPARFYMSVHTLTLHLLPGLQPLPITEATVSADMGSTGWSLSASGPASLFDALEPVSALQPRRVRLTLDGIQWVFVVDSVSRTEAFGQRGARIAGRSPSALLAAPYALQATRANAAQATAQQLAELALDGTGFTLDWSLDDWLIPAGVYSHQGTPLAAVQAIAEAAGGHVLSHRSADALLVRHPYPTLAGGVPGGPWNWTQPTVQPDVVLAADAVITLGTERRDTVPVNGVWVSGVNAGVSRLVRRSGTAGDQLAPQQVDPLITADAAAQQRGLAVLGAAGSKHLQQVQLPILVGSGQPGVLDVGQLVQVNTTSPWRGRVRAVSARSVFGGQVSQTVALERHLAA